MARLALPVAGAAIGFVASGGNPLGAQAGWVAGSLAGAILFQDTIRNVQPRLDDLKVTTGAYGQPLPYVEGAMRVGGWVAWASDRRAIDTTTSQDAKGGPKVETTTTTYEVDMLIILTSHRIAGGRRIWMDGELVWSRAAESDFATVSASSTFARRVTFYTGDPDQMPDPTYEAAVGVGNAPAYRERGSIFLEGLDLGSSGQIRNMTFEVYTASSSETQTGDLASIEISNPQSVGAGVWSRGILQIPIGRWVPGAVSGDQFAQVLEVRAEDGSARVLGGFSVPQQYAHTAGRGISDQPALFLALNATPFDEARVYFSNGSYVEYDLPLDLQVNAALITYCRIGSVMVASRTGSAAAVYRFGAFGAAVAQSVSLGSGVVSLAIRGDRVFAIVQTTPAELVELDLATLAVLSTTPLGLVDVNSESMFSIDEIGNVWLHSFGALFRLNESGQLEEVFDIPGGNGGSGFLNGGSPGVLDGVAYRLTASEDTRAVPRVFWAGVTLETITVQQAVELLHERAGMDLAHVDASALASKSLRGFAVTQISTTRTAIEALMAAHFFQAAKDQGIRYVNRGGSPVLTIPYDDLGSTEAGAESPEPLQIVENNDIEIPAYVAVKYANALDDYQEGLEYSDRLITESTETRVIEFAMAMTPTEARQLAQKIATDLQVSKASVGPLSVQRKYAALQPTDVILVEGRDGLTARMRIDKRDEAAGLIKLEGVLDDASVVIGTATTDTDYSGSFTINLPARTVWQELDIPLLRTVDDGPSFEVAFNAPGSGWRGAVYFGGDDETSLQQITAVSTETVTGSCVTALGSWAGAGLQVTGSVDVQVNGELSSITYDQLLAGGNVAAISSSGRWEILQFQTAELLSAGRYRLRNFLRYLKGTENVTHAVGDRFVLMQTNGIRRVSMTISDISRERVYKAVSVGRQISSVVSEPFTWSGEKLKPLSPTLVYGNRNATDLVITWARRTRHEESWLIGAVPLGEETEAYEVDILNGSTVVRTISTNSPTATYTAAQQTTDFGSPQSSVSVRVYQLSSLVGRGYPAAATV